MASKDFKRIAIVNRGEAAMRLIHAVREYNIEHDAGLTTIALYTDPERQAMFVREADEAYPLGPALFVDEKDGQRKVAYLNYAALEEALLETRADAVWVGWGFVSEHPGFAELCEKKLGLTFIGPDADCMRKLGDKITSKQMAEKAGVPVAPWSGGAVADLDEARTQADRIGLPLMVKATAGGGGRGIRTVRSMDELEEAFKSASSEALGGFGDATVFMERMFEGARHIEVQVIADTHGNVWSVGVRDCSVQRRHQKLIEESSSPVLTAEQEQGIKEAAARLCLEAGYRNAGTVEFLYDPEKREFAFMEVNARLQVEHPVTEVSTDLDMVKLQIHVARGGKLEGFAAIAPMCNDLCDHGVELGRYAIAGLDPRVHAYAGAGRQPQHLDLARGRGEVGLRILGVQADFDRYATNRRRVALELATPRHVDLQLDHVEVGADFGDRVFYLEACIHLHKGKFALLRVVKELHCAGISVARFQAEPRRSLLDALFLFCRQNR